MQALILAGGQGTRLGYDGPKGTFAVTPLKRKSLFQVFAEKITAAGRRYGRPLHWFIMTSHANHVASEAFFADNRYFGLDPARVHFFREGRMPAVDFSDFVVLVRDDLSEDIAHLLTWCIVETREKLERQFRHLPPRRSPVTYPLVPREMAKTAVPLHRGAERYYRDAGLLD